MNLGKLLGVGKSFFGSDPMAAYRLNKRVLLPKFNEGKNPFAPRMGGSAVEPKANPEEKISLPEVSKQQKAPPSYAFKPTAKPVKPMAKPMQALVPATKASRPGWTTRLNPFRVPESAPQPLAVQPELSLNAVKVVHNDLADADVEMVPVKSRIEAPVLPPARQAWEYMGEKLLHPS